MFSKNLKTFVKLESSISKRCMFTVNWHMSTNCNETIKKLLIVINACSILHGIMIIL